MGIEQIFSMKHLVFPVRQTCVLRIECVFPMRVDPAAQYSLQIHPFSGLRPYGMRHTGYGPTAEDIAFFAVRHDLVPDGDSLTMELVFPQEDCYICDLYVGETQVGSLEVYALEEDLFGKNPYKGDNHIHTWMSDGKDSPAYMAAAACNLGYDYCVITDHVRYEPSLIAREYFAATGVDFVVLPGEEVHSPDNPVHIINLGGTDSVNDWWRDHEPEYRAAVERELETMEDPMTPADRYAAAASQVMFDRIRSVDGVAVLCHPHWILPNGFNEHEDITDYLFDHRRFDALELIAGGAYEVGTQMQLSYYNDQPNMPILGNSDAHRCFGGKLEPGNYTIVFADRLDCDGVKTAIRAGLTVAVDRNRIYGNHRLVKYAYFLQRNFYPEHDRQRARLGDRMLRWASSGKNVKDNLTEFVPSKLFLPRRYEA